MPIFYDMDTIERREEVRTEAVEMQNEGRSAIIVGASSGIGYETALRLIGRGLNVFNISRTPCALRQIHNYTADVADGDSLERAIREAALSAEGIYGLIYCAGFSMAAPIEYASEKDYRYLFEVNYFGALRAIRAIVPFLKEKGGRIILVSSMASIFPIAFDCFYSSSKAAVDMLVKGASIELEPYHIHVSSIQPGGTSTAFTFKRKIYSDIESGEYAPKVKRAAEALARMEQGGMSAGEVAKAVVEAFCEKNPPLLLQCGGWNKFYAVAKRVLPEKTAHYLNRKVYRQ